MNALSREELRRHAAELIIAVCLCGGGYYFFVKPVETNVAWTRAQIVEAERIAADVNLQRLGWTASRAALEQAEQFADDIDERGRSARDESAMFTALSNVAADCGVAIDAIQPARQISRHTSAPPTGADQTGQPHIKPPNDVTTAYTVEVRGEYEGVVRMLALLEAEQAYTVVERVEIQTIADPHRPLVRAVVKLNRYAFDTASLRNILAGSLTSVVPANGAEGVTP